MNRIRLRRLLSPLEVVGIATAAASLVHLLCTLLPGDAASVARGPLGPEAVAQARAEWGLDRPAPVQLGDWWAQVLAGDLGSTTGADPTPILPGVVPALERSAILAGISLGLAALVALGLGVAAGLRENGRLDRLLSSVMLTVTATPEFALAALLTWLLAVRAGWLSSTSVVPLTEPVWDHLPLLALPIITLVVASGLSMARMVRASVATTARAPHVWAARMAGLPEWRVVWAHVLPQALPTTAQVLAMGVPFLLGGTVVVETVFGYPGMGSHVVRAVTTRDTNTTAAITWLLAMVTASCYRVADALGARA